MLVEINIGEGKAENPLESGFSAFEKTIVNFFYDL
jgi:hypothetical protein